MLALNLLEVVIIYVKIKDMCAIAAARIKQFSWLISGDDVVVHKIGEKSSQVLKSNGFQDVTFKSYTGYEVRKSSKTSRFLSVLITNENKCKYFLNHAGLATIRSLKRWKKSVLG